MELAKYILSILRTELMVVLSWGFHGAKVIENGISFLVQGYKHTGRVEVVYDEGWDLFNVRIINRDGTLKEEQEGIFVKHPRHKKGEFTVTDSLIAMSKESAYVRVLLKIYRLVIILSSKSKSTDDPAVKIGITGIEENPLESLISISGGRITKKFARRIVKQANR